MTPWNNRPFEIRNLLNPAFCGLLLSRAMKGYEEVNDAGLPFSLSFLILPLTLHKETREVILKYRKSILVRSTSEHPEILVGFPERAQRLVQYTLEGLGFSMHLNSFEVLATGNFKLLPKGVKVMIEGTDEVKECQRVATNIGKEFAKIGDKITIYTSLGVRP